jgi:hypothetical protein
MPISVRPCLRHSSPPTPPLLFEPIREPKKTPCANLLYAFRGKIGHTPSESPPDLTSSILAPSFRMPSGLMTRQLSRQVLSELQATEVFATTGHLSLHLRQNSATMAINSSEPRHRGRCTRRIHVKMPPWSQETGFGCLRWMSPTWLGPKR